MADRSISTVSRASREQAWDEQDVALALLHLSGLDPDRVHTLFDEVERRRAHIQAHSPHGIDAPRRRALLSVYRDLRDGLL